MNGTTPLTSLPAVAEKPGLQATHITEILVLSTVLVSVAELDASGSALAFIIAAPQLVGKVYEPLAIPKFAADGIMHVTELSPEP